MTDRDKKEGKALENREKEKLRREKLRQKALRQLEEEIMARGFKAVAGIDEAGRGPLAGPVVAAAVIFPSDFFIPGINDSKKLLPKQREEIFSQILTAGIPYGIGEATVEEIDRINILQASRLAMVRAVACLPTEPDYLLIDGHAWPGIKTPHQGVIKGDARSLSIAAASILAKVTRDRMMEEVDQKYPEYGFARHKGYATAEHIKALARYGPSPIHRRSFHLKNKQLSLDLNA